MVTVVGRGRSQYMQLLQVFEITFPEFKQKMQEFQHILATRPTIQLAVYPNAFLCIHQLKQGEKETKKLGKKLYLHFKVIFLIHG